MGVFLIIGSVAMGTLTVLCLIMSEVGEDWMQFVIAVCAMAGVTLGFLLCGLYFSTRWRRVRLNGRHVSCQRGWFVFRSGPQRRDLSEFAGLKRFERLTAEMDAGSAVASGIGAAVATAAGAGVGMVAAAQVVPMHFLALADLEREPGDVLLTCSDNPQLVQELMAKLARTFSLPVLDPTLDGFVARGPDDSLSEQLGAPEAAAGASVLASLSSLLADPPEGISVESESTSNVAIHTPRLKTDAIIAICVGAFIAAFGILIAALIVAYRPEEQLLFLICLVTLGVGLLAIGMGISWLLKQRPLVLSAEGMTYFDRERKHQDIRWESVQNITAAKNPATGKTSLLVATKSGDQWVGAGCDMPQLQWLGKVLLAAMRDSAT